MPSGEASATHSDGKPDGFKRPEPRESLLGKCAGASWQCCSQCKHHCCCTVSGSLSQGLEVSGAGLDKLAAKKRAEQGAPEPSTLPSKLALSSCDGWSCKPPMQPVCAGKRARVSEDDQDQPTEGASALQQRQYRAQRVETPSYPGECMRTALCREGIYLRSWRISRDASKPQASLDLCSSSSSQGLHVLMAALHETATQYSSPAIVQTGPKTLASP